MKRTLAISDIHGCYDEFMELLKVSGYNGNKDKLILLGDYIDRGTDSFKVVKKIQELQKMWGNENVIALLGNHEDMLIEALENSKFAVWDHNGAMDTFDSYIKADKLVVNDLDWFKSLLPYYEDEHFYYVHAGFKPNVAIEKQAKNDMVWIREEFYNSEYDFGKPIIFGHTPTTFFHYDSPLLFSKNKFNIDTGCVYRGKLTCLEITNGETMNVYQVDHKKNEALVGA